MWYSTEDSWKFWHEYDPYQNGPYLHREDGPSIITPNGEEYFCLNNKIVYKEEQGVINE